MSAFGLCVIFPEDMSRKERYIAFTDCLLRASLVDSIPSIGDDEDNGYGDVDDFIANSLSNETNTVGCIDVECKIYIGILGIGTGPSVSITQEMFDEYIALSCLINKYGKGKGIKSQLGFHTFDL